MCRPTLCIFKVVFCVLFSVCRPTLCICKAVFCVLFSVCRSFPTSIPPSPFSLPIISPMGTLGTMFTYCFRCVAPPCVYVKRYAVSYFRCVAPPCVYVKRYAVSDFRCVDPPCVYVKRCFVSYFQCVTQPCGHQFGV